MPNRYADRISAIGISVIENGRISKRFYSLINPECRFDSFTVELTGITPAMVADKPTFPELWDKIKKYFDGKILIAHSAQSDMHVLSKCLSSYEIEWTPTVKCLCTLTMGTACYPDMDNHKLDTMCRELSIELEHHNASSDSDGAAMLFLDFMRNGMSADDYIKVYDTVKARMAHVPKKPFPAQVEHELRDGICKLSDERYRREKLSFLRDIRDDSVVGVHKNEIKKYAQALSGTAKATEFLRLLPHKYQEENDLHAYLINGKKRYASALELTEAFLPYIDNTETCDILAPKAFRNHPSELLPEIKLWLFSYRSYTVRFGINMLIKHFLSDSFTPEIIDIVYSVKELTPPVKSILPTFYSAATELQYDSMLPYLEDHVLDTETHNKTIKKCLSNANIPKNRKSHLKDLIV